MHAEEEVLQYQQYQLSSAVLCSVSRIYIEVQIILYTKRLRMRERNSVLLILHLGLKFHDYTQVYLLLGQKNPTATLVFI